MSQKFKLVVVLLSLVVFLSKGMTIHAEESQKYLFIGDSRFVGMQDSCQNKEGYSDITWLCKVGMDSSGVDENWATIESTPKDTIIIYEMGINGMAFQNNLDQVQRIKDLGFKVYYVEIAPVDESKPSASRTSKDVEDFNSKLNSFAKEIYTVIPCYDILSGKLTTSDYDEMGIHYNSNAYRLWYDIIFEGLKEKEPECKGVVNSKRLKAINKLLGVDF